MVECPDLKFIESFWDVLEETLQIAGLLHCPFKIWTKNVSNSFFLSWSCIDNAR